jgi:hypothetical protein
MRTWIFGLEGRRWIGGRMNEALVVLGLRTGGVRCLIRWSIRVGEWANGLTKRGCGVNVPSGGSRRWPVFFRLDSCFLAALDSSFLCCLLWNWDFALSCWFP